MPVFHTKTIESILDPVAQQVSRLVIIHEEGEAGHEMPDLQRPVVAVSKAVENLTKVGSEMVSSSEDPILRDDMPRALHKVEMAAKLLEEAASLSHQDPRSKLARTKLIEGSRWILQGTSNVLLVFDESEVRKIIAECKKVMDYLSVAEVIETMEDLVQFVKDLSPCLSKVTKEVTKRMEDLTHQVHREILSRCVEQVKTLAPILICSMKIFIQLYLQGGKGVNEAAENRNYLASRMTEEMTEIIRVLQLTTYGEDEWDSDKLTLMKKALSAFESNQQNGHDWLQDPTSVQGGVGEKAIRRVLESALKVMNHSLPNDAEHLAKLCGDIQSMSDALCELREKGEGKTPQAEALARGIEDRLHELKATVQQAISRVEKSGLQYPAPTVAGRLEQARRWLEQPGVDDRGLGRQAIALVVEEGYKIADVLTDRHRNEVVDLCENIELEYEELSDLCRDGKGDTPMAIELARSVAGRLDSLRDIIRTALVDRVVEDFIDAGGAVKQFTDCVIRPDEDPEVRDQVFEEKAGNLTVFASKAVATAKMVAVGTNSGNKKVAEALMAQGSQVDALTPQLISAGRIRMVYPDNKAADEHFENLRQHFIDAIHKVRHHCDEATDSLAFVTQSLQAMNTRGAKCEEAIQSRHAVPMVENTSALARLANRVVQIAKQEVDNTEDPTFNRQLMHATEDLHDKIAPVVHSAKSLATSIGSDSIARKWRHHKNELLEAAERVQRVIAEQPTEQPPLPPYPNIHQLSLQDAPPRPPLPAESSFYNDTTTDDESEEYFLPAPTPSQGPIMLAAHDLHQEVKQWSSKDNDIIAAAKKMALLMAKLSQLVGQDASSKRELISCAKSIADSSEEVTRIAKELAKECTDKRMRTSLLQVCERIPTIATQLKILSTVKATMLGAQGTEEDREATDMLVGNAQNLMQSVKLTVTAAEAASIKIRTDAGIRLKWVRKQPWYQY